MLFHAADNTHRHYAINMLTGQPQAGTISYPCSGVSNEPAFDEVRWADGWDAFRLQGGPAWDKLLDAMIDLARYGAAPES